MGFKAAIRGLFHSKPQYGARAKAGEKGNTGPKAKKSDEETSFEQFIKKVKGPKIK